MRLRWWYIVPLLLGIIVTGVHAQISYDATVQSPEMAYNEAQAVYLGNVERINNGLPPLRWNYELTQAARWFSWDSTENRSVGFCEHIDTNGDWPSDRAIIFGYLGRSGSENAYCGYVSPTQAIAGWMASDGHRANLLDPNPREVGLGYYQRPSDLRGWVTQTFGYDTDYPPAIINNEAVSTTSTGANLYIYDRQQWDSFASLSPATQMMVSNNVCFTNASWETYKTNKSWTLASGEGWKNVYVRTKDAFNRTMTVKDTIYLGSSIPTNQINETQMSETDPYVTLYKLDGGGRPKVQYSLGWLADDTHKTFQLWWGNGERVNDSTAWGGTAFRLRPGNGNSYAWVNNYMDQFYTNTPMVAYFRLKVNNNTSTNEVIKISVKGGTTVYGPVSLKGTDFSAANQYQEFQIAFTHTPNTTDAKHLIFDFTRTGTADVYVDAVSIFSAPVPLTGSTMTFNIPSRNYRGQGVWVRYTDGANNFTPFFEGVTMLPELQTANAELDFMAGLAADDPPPGTREVPVSQECGSSSWEVYSTANWLIVSRQGNNVHVEVDLGNLREGGYDASFVVQSTDGSALSTEVPVHLNVVRDMSAVFLPAIRR